MAEAYVWGREFQLGYFAHPPFWAWIAGLWFEFFPRVDWAFYLLSMLNAGLGLLGSWFLIGNFASGDRRLAATALLLLTPFCRADRACCAGCYGRRHGRYRTIGR